jgi:glycosyltransferase involved in cell wall biosynthesis
MFAWALLSLDSAGYDPIADVTSAELSESSTLDASQALADERAQRIRQLEQELQVIYASKSWRLTAPMRGSRRLLELRLVLRAGRFARAMVRTIRSRLPTPVKRGLRTLLRRPAIPAAQTPDAERLTLAPMPSISAPSVGQVSLRPGQPLVSVVIPCFNYGAFVREAVDSAFGQTLDGVEVIVVDDGSTDPATRSVLDELRSTRMTVVRQPNGGLPSARNQGIAVARGRYVCCLDADDRLGPTYLEKAIALLEADRGVGFVYSWVQIFGDEDSVWHTEPFDLAELRQRNFISVSAVFRRDDWEMIGGFAEDMREGYEDWEFWLRLGASGRRGVLIPEPLFEHRLHGRTMIFEAHDRHDELVARLHEHHAPLYDDDARVEQLARSYAAVPVVPPFANLERSRSELADERSAPAGLLAIVPWLPAGGGEAVLHAVLSGLRARPSFSLSIVTCHPSQNEWQKRFSALTDEIYHLPAFLPPELWAPFVHHLITTRRVKSLLVSGAEFGYSLLPELKREYPFLRTVEILHNASPIGHIASSVRFTSVIDHHVVVAESIARALAGFGVQPSKTHVIPNGVDTDLFDPTRYRGEDERRRLGLVRDQPVITYIGRLSAEKQPLEFLSLASSLADTPAQFVLVGDGPQRDAVAARLNDPVLHKRVHWLKHVLPECMPSLLAATDALAITSSVEGLPIVMLESLAMGVPVFTYDVGDVRAAITDALNGYVFEPDDLVSMTSALRSFLADRNEQQTLRSRARPSLIERGLTLGVLQRAYTSLLTDSSAISDRVGS